MTIVLSAVFLQSSPGSVSGVNETAAIVVGTLLTVAVIYAIVAANLRKTKGPG